MEQFHFLRPGWLLLLMPLALLAWQLWRVQSSSNSWRQLIQPQLLSHLLDTQQTTLSRWPLLALLTAWLLATLALAGPTWEKLPQPIYKKQDAQVLILDLSPSMLAQDQKPSRLVHARHRLIDLLKARTEGLTGLVVFAGDAHVLAPLSSDRETLLALVPSLSPGIMPVRGSRSEAAVAAALQLLKDAGHSRGRLLLITDGVEVTARDSIRQQLTGSNYSLSILGVGSAAGAPVPLRDGSFAKDAQGDIYLARLDASELRQLAIDSGGVYSDLSYAGEDVRRLLQPLTLAEQALPSAQETSAIKREFDLWEDAGVWLLLLLLPIAALSHRRGWLLLVLIVPMLQPTPVYAFEWQDLWKNKDQQAAEAFSGQQYDKAGELFKSPAWKGSAQYRSGNYEAAVQSFASSKHADDWYNRGNALARSGKLQEATEAFDQALQLDPAMEDAQFNKQLVEELLKQQQQQQDQQEQQKEGQTGEQGQQGEEGQQGKQDSQDQQGQQSSAGQQQDNAQQQPESSPSAAKPSNEDQSADSKAAEQQDQQSQQQSQPQQSASSGDHSDQNPGDEAAASEEMSEQQRQQQQELEKWLRQLPDDPSGLLRRKFQYQYQQKLEAYQRGEWQPSGEVRW